MFENYNAKSKNPAYFNVLFHSWGRNDKSIPIKILFSYSLFYVRDNVSTLSLSSFLLNLHKNNCQIFVNFYLHILKVSAMNVSTNFSLQLVLASVTFSKQDKQEMWESEKKSNSSRTP